MAQAPLNQGRGDPLRLLHENVFCDDPPDQLTVEQLFALHEFFHTVLAAGYKLYQVVPADKASVVVKQKFAMMVGALPPATPDTAT
jgi:hypothetical protein